MLPRLECEAGARELLAEEARIVEQLRAQPRRVLEQIQHRKTRRRDHRRDAVGEQVRSRTLPQPVDDLAARGHITAAAAAQGLAERAGEDVDAPGHAAVLGRAAPRGSHEAGRVRVIDHDERVVAFGELADAAQIGDEAVHGEHPVGRDQAGARPARLLQALLQLRHVAVGVTVALRLAQADAVDDARMVQRIRDHRVALVEQRLEQPAVGVEARGVQDHILGAEVARQALFQLLMARLRAADEAHRGHAVAELVQAALRCGTHRGVVGQAQVVVGTQVDEVAPAGVHDAALGALEHALALVQALFAQGRKLRAQPLDDSRIHGAQLYSRRSCRRRI